MKESPFPPPQKEQWKNSFRSKRLGNSIGEELAKKKSGRVFGPGVLGLSAFLHLLGPPPLRAGIFGDHLFYFSG